ncbi:MAG: RIP metalloprotease RseP [Proteobacteria bacterium]|nr:RIP metalloprotease RseP [Pseudomonadota bacterium]
MILSIITVVLVLSFLVFAHELGHYLAAKKVGVRVLEFSIGFPPKIVSKVVGKTEYMISLIPLGGYVRLEGQNIDDEDPEEPENYAAKNIWQRFVILIAGPVMNLFIALVFICLVFFIGYEAPAYLMDPPVIDDIAAGSEAEKLDIRKNDLILEINNKKVNTWKEAQTLLKKIEDPMISLKLQRGQQIVQRRFSSTFIRTQNGLGLKIDIEPVVGKISSQSPAATAGFQTGDRILGIEGQSVEVWSQISPLVRNSKGKEIAVSISRNNMNFDIPVTPVWNEDGKYWVIGISSQTVNVSETFADSILLGAERTYLITLKTFEFLYKMIVGEVGTESIGGPIMIAQMVDQAARSNISSLISLIGFISLQFAVFNLLPIPALDGGHIFFLGLEKIKGRALSKNFRVLTQRAGFSILMILILYISIQDGIRLFQG